MDINRASENDDKNNNKRHEFIDYDRKVVEDAYYQIVSGVLTIYGEIFKFWLRGWSLQNYKKYNKR